ncbi:unnamed protein product [Ixodes persulcatus]
MAPSSATPLLGSATRAATGAVGVVFVTLARTMPFGDGVRCRRQTRAREGPTAAAQCANGCTCRGDAAVDACHNR